MTEGAAALLAMSKRSDARASGRSAESFRRSPARLRPPRLSSAVDYILGLSDTMMDEAAKRYLKRSVGTSAGAEIRAWVNRYASSLS